MRTVAFFIVAMCTMIIGAVAGSIQTLTAEEFIQHQADHVGVPTLVRFHLPWDPEGEANTAAFTKASEVVPNEIAHFVEIKVDSLEAFVIADVHSITAYPSIKLLGVNIQRPNAPKGAQIAGRPVYLGKDFSGNQHDADALVEFIIRETPTRILDPITNQITQSVVQINDESHIAPIARVAPKTAKNGVLFYLPTTFRSDKKHATALQHNLVLSAIYAQAAQNNQRMVVFTTSDAEIAGLFGIKVEGDDATFCYGAVFSLADAIAAKKGDRKTIAVTVESLTTPGGVGEIFANHALNIEEYSKQLGYTLRQWKMDMKEFATRSPLRKLESLEQFNRDVTENKQGAVVVFLLRETDKFFTRHHKVAIDAANWARAPTNTHPITGEKLSQASMMRFDVFWVDAEVHPEVATRLGAKAVPSVGVILSLQQQEGVQTPTKGIKYFPITSDFPDSVKFINFITSQELFAGKDILPFDPATIKFVEGGKTTKPQLATPTNNAYLGLDFRNYDEDEPEADVFELGKKREGADDTKKAGKKKGKKVNSEKAKLKQMKADAEKKKLAEELAAKKAEKEAKIKAKADADRKRREEEVEAAKKLKEERKKNPEKFKKAKKPKKESKESQKERLAKLRKNKAPKDRQAIRKEWTLDGVRMAKKYMSGEDDKIEVSQKLDM